MKESVIIKVLPFLSAVFQLGAAVMAVMHGRRAFHRLGWVLFCAAFVLMFSRRVLGFLRLSEGSVEFLFLEELITLFTSLLVLAGTYFMGRAFKSLVSAVEAERKAQEKERNALDFMHTLFDCIPIPTFAVDTEGRAILWNRACEDLTALRRDGILGRKPDFSSLYPGRKAPPTLAELLITMTPEEIVERFKKAGVWIKENAVVVETSFRVGDSMKTVKLIAGRVYDGKGIMRGAIQTAQDVTSERRAEQYLRTFQKIEAIGRLAVGIAHDFRNILMIAQTATELLPEEYLKDRAVMSCVEEIRQAVKRGSELCNHLMRFAGLGEEKPFKVFLNTVIVEWERMFRRLLRENIHLTVDLAPDLWAIEATPAQIERIITNLVLNAQEAIPDGGSIVIRTENVRLSGRDVIPPARAGRFVRLTVEDTGVGMDEETRERIFEPFFSTKRRNGRAGGMGLYVVYSEVKNMGGFIEVKSEPGKGSAFYIYFPALHPVVHTGAERVAQAGTEEGERMERRGCVLLVEDEPSLREMLAEFLVKRGFVVHKAGDGREALEVFQRIRDELDVVITDVGLPGEMDGCALVEKILSQREDIRVVVMTGYATERVTKSIADKGCVEVVNKPFSVVDILRLLEKGGDR